MKLVKKDKELRNVALTVKLTASERSRLAELARHYETSNADLLVWLVDQDLARAEGTSDKHSTRAPNIRVENTSRSTSTTPSDAVLETLTAQVALLAQELKLLRVEKKPDAS
jgi:hypothetical protein